VAKPLTTSVSPSGQRTSTTQPNPGLPFRATKAGRYSGISRICAYGATGSSRSSDNNQTDRPQPAVDGNTAPANAAREGLATARPVVFAASTGRFWISQERQGVIAWFEFTVFRGDIVVGSLGCACRKSNPNILVVQPAENWAAKNLSSRSTARETGASFSRDRCVRASL
jgi:hypothetical protein